MYLSKGWRGVRSRAGSIVQLWSMRLVTLPCPLGVLKVVSCLLRLYFVRNYSIEFAENCGKMVEIMARRLAENLF